MAYQISLSRKSFDTQIDDIIRRLKDADKPGVSPALRDFSIAAAIFLAHAEFENYFVDVLGRLAAMYSNAAVTAAQLPARLRAHLIYTKLNLEALAGKVAARAGEPDILLAVEKWFASPSVALIDQSKPLTPFNGASIHGDQDYPSTKNIQKVLQRIGIGDPTGALNKAGKRDAFLLLKSVADLRTSLAHTATLPGISVEDVRDRLGGLKVFVRSMDRALYLHGRKSCSQAAWTAAMC